jgi:hypothetical protein
MGIIQILKALYRAKLVNYILQAIWENRLTTSLTVKKVCTRTDILQAAQFTYCI